MARKAPPILSGGQSTAKSCLDGVRRLHIEAGGEVKGVQRTIKAEPALVESVVVMVDVGLTFVAEAEGPLERLGEGIGVSCYGVGQRSILAFDFVVVGRTISGNGIAVEEHLRVSR